MPNQTRVLIVGVGSIGERHTRCFQETGRVDLSICETNARLRDEVATRYGLSEAFSEFEEALDNPPEAAVICTPAPLHVPIATKLANAGVHLLIEKPLSTSLDGIDTLKAVVKQRGLVVAVGYSWRSHPLVTTLRQTLLDERFGRPVQLVVNAGQNFPYYRPAYREIYYNNRATGGGAIQDALTHLVNLGEWLVGPVTELAADAAHQLLEGVLVEDTVHLITRHGSVLASYALNQYQAANECTITAICERGMVRIEPHKNRWRWITGPEDDWHDENLPPLKRDLQFVTQANSFLDAIEGKSPPVCTLDEGLQTLRVNLAILTAVDTRCWQTL
jgi:predicted dehydrogenase